MSRARNTTTAPTGSIAPLGLRLLPELRVQIEEAAREHGRSLNAEVSARLQASFEPSDTDQLRDLQLAVARAQVESLAAQREAMHYSIALMYIAGRIPPGVLEDAPAIADLLKKLNTGRKAQLVETATKMLADGVEMATSIKRLAELEKSISRE